MRHYVFIARDESEFERYPREGYKELCTDFAKALLYKTNDDFSVLILSGDVKSVDVHKMCLKVAAAIKIAHGDAVVNIGGEVYLFVHMGGEGDAGIEKLEQELQNELEKFVKNNKLGKWKLFLLSSRFPNRINVKKTHILLPNNERGFENLIKRCELRAEDLGEIIMKGFLARCNLARSKKNWDSYMQVCKVLSIVKEVKNEPHNTL